jgi:hypothetical protein
VQAGVNGTLPGGTVHVAAGAYAEQVIVAGKSLTIRGAGSGATTIQAPAVLTTTFTTSGPNKPVVTADGAADVRIQDLKVDGMGNGNANNRIVGIGFWNAGGQVSNVAIDRVRNNPLNGVQAGVGVLASNNTGGPYALAISATVITDFQKNGPDARGAGLTVSVTGGSITGAGTTGLIAQNAIQISGGAGGTGQRDGDRERALQQPLVRGVLRRPRLRPRAQHGGVEPDGREPLPGRPDPGLLHRRLRAA